MKIQSTLPHGWSCTLRIGPTSTSSQLCFSSNLCSRVVSFQYAADSEFLPLDGEQDLCFMTAQIKKDKKLMNHSLTSDAGVSCGSKDSREVNFHKEVLVDSLKTLAEIMGIK